jgi:hypothetical protein
MTEVEGGWTVIHLRTRILFGTTLRLCFIGRLIALMQHQIGGFGIINGHYLRFTLQLISDGSLQYP